MAEIVVSRLQQGASVELRPGDTLVVHLPETPSTGFRWAARTIPASVLTPSGDSYVPGPDSGIGGGGTRYLRFRALGAGSHELSLVLWRDWEGESSITDRFSIVVIVA
jgi:inhibitor of cysteine peptidase